MKLEAKTGTVDWTALTKYVKSSGEHALDGGSVHMLGKSVRFAGVGPTRAKRELEYRVRKTELAERLEITGGTGNLMVNMCRSLTRQAVADKALRVKGGPGRTQMHHPNRRIAWYGLWVNLAGSWEQADAAVFGGTRRQVSCYRRAVERFLTDPAQGNR